MQLAVELARLSEDGYVLEFPRKFRWFGWTVTAVGLLLWASLILEWREVGGLGRMSIDQFLVVRVFSLPFGVGLLVWSSQKIAVYQNLIESLHLGRRKQLDRSTSSIHSKIKSGIYLKDGRGKRLFASNWLVGFERLVEELSSRDPGR